MRGSKVRGERQTAWVRVAGTSWQAQLRAEDIWRTDKGPSRLGRPGPEARDRPRAPRGQKRPESLLVASCEELN